MTWQWVTSKLCVRVWLPAFAGNTEDRKQARFPQRGKIHDGKSPLSGGSTGEAGVGGLVFFLTPHTRVPREGGDPDPLAQTENGPLTSCRI